jgi:hypothetical protein
LGDLPGSHPARGAELGYDQEYGLSDAADLFVFISGYTAAFVFGRIMIERGYLGAAARLVKRALELYAAHIIVVTQRSK